MEYIHDMSSLRYSATLPKQSDLKYFFLTQPRFGLALNRMHSPGGMKGHDQWSSSYSICVTRSGIRFTKKSSNVNMQFCNNIRDCPLTEVRINKIGTFIG